MPNWVFCNLSVSGEKSAVETFDAEMKKPHPTFVYPEGQENRGYGHLDGKWKMTEGGEFSFWNAIAPEDLESYFTGSQWYDWNNRYWGTKWDVNVEDKDDYIGTDGSYNITYRFDTAWSPPTEVFVALCEKYPNLDLTLGYEEEQGWGGELQSDNDGGWYRSEEYDIPESHADYVERGKEDCCNCAEGDDEYWFDDCPREDEDEDESKTIIVNDLTSITVS